MLIVPAAPVPSQNLAINLDGQQCSINIYQLGVDLAAALYMDLLADGTPIFTARICRGYGGQPDTAAPFMLQGRQYLGFLGDFCWLDTQATATNGALDPEYSGLGARWQLMYFSPDDLSAIADVTP